MATAKTVSLRCSIGSDLWLVTCTPYCSAALVEAGPMAAAILAEALRLESLGHPFAWRYCVKAPNKFAADAVTTQDVADDFEAWLEPRREAAKAQAVSEYEAIRQRMQREALQRQRSRKAA